MPLEPVSLFGHYALSFLRSVDPDNLPETVFGVSVIREDDAPLQGPATNLGRMCSRRLYENRSALLEIFIHGLSSGMNLPTAIDGPHPPRAFRRPG